MKGRTMSYIPAKKTADEEKNGKFVVSINPATGKELGVSKLNTPDDVRYAVERARKVQPVWAANRLKNGHE